MTAAHPAEPAPRQPRSRCTPLAAAAGVLLASALAAGTTTLLGAATTAAPVGATAQAAPAAPAAEPAGTAPAAATPSGAAAAADQQPAAPTPPATPATPAAPAPATPATPAPTAPAAPANATPEAPAPAATPESAKPDAKATAKKGKASSKTAAAKPAAPAKPAPPPPKPPVPNAALAQLKPLEGSWTCTGKTFGPGPEHPTAATLTFAWQLDGFWLEVRYQETRAATNTVPVSFISEWGYDELQKTLATTTVDNVSGIDNQSGNGWQGDKLVFAGAAHRFGTQFLDRDTFVRHGDSQLLHTLEASVNDSWIKLHVDTCNRVPTK